MVSSICQLLQIWGLLLFLLSFFPSCQWKVKSWNKARDLWKIFSTPRSPLVKATSRFHIDQCTHSKDQTISYYDWVFFSWSHLSFWKITEGDLLKLGVEITPLTEMLLITTLWLRLCWWKKKKMQRWLLQGVFLPLTLTLDRVAAHPSDFK